MHPQTDLTPRQRAAVDHRGSNMLVEAVPGSGKTRVIVARCAALIRNGIPAHEILVLTFSRKAVGELRARLGGGVADDARPEIRTFHGFAARLLADAGEAGRSRRLLSEPAERSLFENVVSTTALASLPAGVADSRLFRDTAATRVDEIRRAPADAIARLSARATPRIADLVALDAEQKRLRDRLGVADFDDLVARAVRLAGTPGSALATALRTRYKHVLVDEFQDTDPLQLALLEHVKAEIFAVGDEAQAIYGFRGAARDAMNKAQIQLRMELLPLDESFRCPAAICELARSVWPEKIALASRTAVTGDISFRRAASPHDEASYIAHEIASAIASGTPENKIAVLLRAAEPMATLLRTELRERGIAATRQGGEKLLDDPAVDAICTALRALASPDDANVWVRLFSHPAFGLDALAVRLALGNRPPHSVEHACALLEGLSSAPDNAGATVAAALRTALEHWKRDEPVTAARSFTADSNILGFVISGDEDRARLSATRIKTFLEGLGDVHDVRAKLGIATSSASVFEAFASNAAQWRAGGEFLDEGSGVAILTVHAAKGLEFDFVIVADAVEGHFPQTWRPDTLLSPADIELARECGVDLGTVSGEHDHEERSLWYVAVTRSERKLLVTWPETDAEGSPLRPSRFIPLAARTAEAQRPSFRGPLEYLLAPSLTDRQTPTPAQITRPIRTSAMESWFACRRKFYYNALLKIGSDERGFNAKLGTLVHRAIATFHDAVRDFRTVTSGAHAAWAARLRELAREIVASEDFDAFDSPLEVDAALRAADRFLDRYARSLERSANAEDGGFEVLSTEELVAYDVGGLAFSGKIDRIDRHADGSLMLVDVKTGRLKDNGEMLKAFPKLAEAVTGQTLWAKATPPANPQLPLYRHAKPETGALSYLYLGSHPKFGQFGDVATDDRLELATNPEAIEAIDRALTETFFVPWTTSSVTWLEPTRVARTCKYCEFESVCPGYLEDDD
jgi:superfamily I DNA/RNA helicase